MDDFIEEKRIIQGEDGVYRWIYEFSLFKNPIILFVIWKVLIFSFGAVWIFVTLLSVNNTNFWWEGFLNETKGFALILAFVLALGLVAYLIYAVIMGGKYYVLFEMDSKGVKHTQLSGQFKKARALADMTVFLGLVSGKPGTVGSGLLAGSKQSISSEWKKVKSVAVYPRRNTIKVNEVLNRNQIYASDTNFEFVRQYVAEHCTDAKIRMCR